MTNPFKPISDSDIKIIAEFLGTFFTHDPKKIVYWLYTDNPNFGGFTPASLIDSGRGRKVVSFIEGTKQRNYR